VTAVRRAAAALLLLLSAAACSGSDGPLVAKTVTITPDLTGYSAVQLGA